MNSIKKSVKIMGLILVICLIYRLHVIPIILCMIASIVFNTFYINELVIGEKNLAKFNDVVLYMEQMIYSFNKQSKIRLALLDAQKVSAKSMKEVIEEAILNIDSRDVSDIYEESLGIISNEYECKRIRSLHEFLIKIELHGGEYEDYINILLEDIKEWSDRTLAFVKDVTRVKRNVLISIGSTIITCGFMSYLIPAEYKFSEHIIYQICSTFMIVAMLFSYLFAIRKLNFDWIKEEGYLPDNLIIKYYMLVERGYEDFSTLKPLEKLVYKKAKKTLEKEIVKAFPDWIRQVAINLQNDTVQSAIESSFNEAAVILKRPIRKLLIDFEKYPVGIEPYDLFLKEFDLVDIKSSMKMFYTINELGKTESTKQVNAIIDRNNKFARQAEEMKNKDRVGLAGLFTAMPMLIGVIKIMADMILMIIVFTSSLSNVVNGG